jgi:hypothetical protein
MYKMIYLTNNSYKHFQHEQDGLLKDLELYGRSYPELRGELFGRIIELLRR